MVYLKAFSLVKEVEWEHELEEGEFIIEFVVGGAKSFAYKTNTGKTVIEQQGITMDVANSKVITVETMQDMVLNNTVLNHEDRYTYRWDSKSNDVITKFLSRGIISTVIFKTKKNY